MPEKYMELKVEKISESGFMSIQHEWNTLHQRSCADPLFLSWAWNWSWWATWHEKLNLELCLITVRDGSGLLVGIAPLYRHSVNYADLTQIVRLQSIGNAWTLAPTVRSEYMGFIADSSLELHVYQAIWKFLHTEEVWDELVLCDVNKESPSYRMFAALARMSDGGFVVASEDSGVNITVDGSFRDYLSSLGRNTRLKLYNRRERLAERGSIEQVRVAPERYESFFKLLNQLHATRWGRGCYVGLSEKFHLKLLSYLPESSVHCLIMKQGGKNISALYDLELGGRRYNLQAGYLENYHSKVSLGTLHLGYGVEQAWQTPECKGYDLLAGSGKHSFYKRHLGKSVTQFATVRITRKSKSFTLYQLVERLPGKWRKKLKRD